MSRLQGTCTGDCSKCELLASGEVDMMPCILDQIFQRVQKNERMVNVLVEKITKEKKAVFVSVEPNKNENDEIPEND